MTEIDYVHPVLLHPPQPAPHMLRNMVKAAIAVGALAFVVGLIVSPQRTWQAYFVNFLFWAGIAQGGIVMAAVYRITNARWGDQFRRIGEGMIVFLPVSFILYLVLVAAGGSVFPWLEHGVGGGKGIWLSWYFLFTRDGIAFAFLFWLSYRFVYYSIRPDLGLLEQSGVLLDPRTRYITRGWQGWDAEVLLSKEKLARLTPALLIAFGTLYSLIGFDLVMALDPFWYSTLFGWMYALHAFFASLTVTAILGYFSTRWFGLGDVFVRAQWHDMGRFIFGFALLAGGFFWSQFLVIWYGNLPEESSYLIKRFYSQPWEPLMWVYIVMAYLFPLVVFLSARVKQIPGALASIAALILLALFLERFISVVPFIWKQPSIPFGLLEIGVTLGFLGLFLRSWLAFTLTVPIVPARPEPQPPRVLSTKNPSAIS